jgi:hypothetical protein
MFYLNLILSALIGGITNRIRGGLFGHEIGLGDTFVRIFAFGLPMGLLSYYFGLPLFYALLMWVGFYLGCVQGQYGSLSMGHAGGTKGILAWLAMFTWGLGRIIIPAGVLYYYSSNVPYFMLATAFLCPIVYNIVWYFPKSLFFTGGFGKYITNGYVSYDPPEIAELINGMLIGLSLALSV